MADDRKQHRLEVEGVGCFFCGFFRGEDLWGNWHEDDMYGFIETEDGKHIDVTGLFEEAFESSMYTICGSSNYGEECEEEHREECSYLNEKRICTPHLVKFRIVIETEILEKKYC